VKHPRVVEVEEKMRDEVARYFTRRFPQEPFFIKVEIAPLRRDMVAGQKMESLPYFDYESEESVDEWDDPKTPLAFLRHRVTKVSVEISVPAAFDDARVAEIKDEIQTYLKLLPFRDSVNVVKKFKVEQPPLITTEQGLMMGGLLLSALLVGLLVRSGFSKVKTQAAPTVAAPSVAAAPALSRERSSLSHKGSTAVSGDVTFHDPLKTIDIIHMKQELIEKSGTFPTLSDLLLLHEMGEKSPARLGALIYEMPAAWQKQLFPLGMGQSWLEAFCAPGQIDHECLSQLDRLGKERSYASDNRETEELLIQIWRMGEKAVLFLKKIPQDHAFILLNMMPKSVSLGLAKKAFPGAWGRLLENQTTQNVIDAFTQQVYLGQAQGMEPQFEWRLLENYRKDRELLKYLDTVSIDDEKDIYETLSAESFVLRVRPAFSRVFELEGEKWREFVSSYPLDKWALVVMNSSRNYIRQVQEVLDEKQRAVLSQHLKNFDQGFDLAEQIEWRKTLATAAETVLGPLKKSIIVSENVEASEHAKSA
jgi:hypothetical protein